MNQSLRQKGKATGMERRVIRFFLVALLLLVVLVLAIAARQGVFTKTARIYFFAEDARGITPGMSVKLIGFRVGSVEEVAMTSNAKVKVALTVDASYLPMIGRDAHVRLMKEDLVGESVIAILPGSQEGRRIANNGVVVFEREAGLGEIAESLTNEIRPILRDVHQITAYINQPDGDVRQTLHNLNLGTAKLTETGNQAQTLIGNANHQIDLLGSKTGTLLDGVAGTLHKADGTLDNLNAVSVNAKKLSEDVSQQLPTLLQKAEGTLDNLQATSANARQLSTDAARQLPQMVRDGGTLLQDTLDIMDGAKHAWPVKNLLPEQTETSLPLDSYVPVIAQPQ